MSWTSTRSRAASCSGCCACSPTICSATRRTWSSWRALLAESGQRLPRLRTILAIGETLTEEARGHIESGFGVPVKTTYSCVEAGYLASPCPAGHGLHVHSENVLLEVLDEQGQPCRPGQTGQVVLTTLHNFLTPLLRYRILDAATLGPERCPCGRGLPLLARVEGKRRPVPTGRRPAQGLWFPGPAGCKLGGYQQHQIIQQSADRLTVRLVPDRCWSADHSAQVVRWVQEYFEAPIRVEVELVGRLEMTLRRQGPRCRGRRGRGGPRMSFFPLRRIPGMSWPNVPPGPVSQLWGMYLRLEQTQWLSPEEIVQGQLAQVRGLLAHCGQHVPYYRDLLKKVGVRPADVTTLGPPPGADPAAADLPGAVPALPGAQPAPWSVQNQGERHLGDHGHPDQGVADQPGRPVVAGLLPARAAVVPDRAARVDGRDPPARPGQGQSRPKPWPARLLRCGALPWARCSRPARSHLMDVHQDPAGNCSGCSRCSRTTCSARRPTPSSWPGCSRRAGSVSPT